MANIVSMGLLLKVYWLTNASLLHKLAHIRTFIIEKSCQQHTCTYILQNYISALSGLKFMDLQMAAIQFIIHVIYKSRGAIWVEYGIEHNKKIAKFIYVAM